MDWDDTSRALLIDNDSRRTLDAYERFHTGYPCWHEESTDKYKYSGANDRDYTRDGLWHFSTRP